MGKCASKDVVNGQIVPEVDAGSPMFAPEAPLTVGAEETAGAEVTFQGFSPAPVEPVAAALPTTDGSAFPQPRGVSVDEAGVGHQYHKAYPVHAAGGPEKLYMSLEEAEAAARKQNEQWGVAHIPYDPNAYNHGQTTANYEHRSYADAFPPSHMQQPSEPRPAELATGNEHQQPPSGYQPAYQQHEPARYEEHQPAAAPERPSLGGQSYGGVREVLPPQQNAYPPVAAEPVAVPEHQPVVAAEPAPAAAEPAIQVVSVPEAAAAPAEDAVVVPATDSKKKKKKSSKKTKNWAWF